MQESVGVAMRVAVGTTLCLAGCAKLADLQRFGETLRGFPLTRILITSKAMAKTAAVSLAVIELLLGVAFVAGYRVRLLSFSIAGLLVAFAIGITVALLSREKIECGCFGSASSEPVRWRTVGRNVLLIVLVWIAAQWDGMSADAVLDGRAEVMELGAAVFLSVQAVLLCAGLWSFARLRSLPGYVRQTPQMPNPGLGEVWEGPRDKGHRRAIA